MLTGLEKIPLPSPTDRTKLALIIIDDDPDLAWKAVRDLYHRGVPVYPQVLTKDKFTKAKLREAKNALMMFLVGNSDSRVMVISHPFRDKKDFEWVKIRLDRADFRTMLLLSFTDKINEEIMGIVRVDEWDDALERIVQHFRDN
ncbi:MAG: hypothetical protein D6698_12265 [Gammaproteobacteria bacterium]|nr:MAG: hypothetical protein D6698_12265 [Gammaproteobacteria bacterium]